MVCFAITAPKRISCSKELTDSNAEIVSKMNSIISMYSGGGFMSYDIAQSIAAQRLMSSKLLTIGNGEYPLHRLLECVISVFFGQGREHLRRRRDKRNTAVGLFLCSFCFGWKYLLSMLCV